MQKAKAKVPVKDLTKEPPRSPRTRLGGFVILPRMLDKCRAALLKKSGEYHFNCELDKRLLSFKGVTADNFKKFVATGATDDEVIEWVRQNGKPKSEAEIARWSEAMEVYAYADDAEGKEWLLSKNKLLGVASDGTLFDYLDADDKASFPSGSNVCL